MSSQRSSPAQRASRLAGTGPALHPASPAHRRVVAAGLAGAAVTWAAVTRLSSRPEWLFTRLAALATAVFLIPDFLLVGTPGNPTGPVVVLMLMHLASAVITYTTLIKVAPVRGGA